MAITKKQLEERRHYLGSSDISSLFNDKNGNCFNPHQTAVGVWSSKIHRYTYQEPTEAQDRGNRYEAALIKYASKKLGVKIETRPKLLNFKCDKHPIFAANLDGIAKFKEPEIVEAKTTNISDEYGEPGTGQVPIRVIFQTHHQFLCTGYRKAHIVVMLARYSRLMECIYVINRNEDIINAIIKKGEKFWKESVLAQKAPVNGGESDLELFKTMVRVPNKYADKAISNELIAEWDSRKAEESRAKKAVNAIKATIIALLGDAEAAKITGGEKEFTYFPQSRKGMDNDKLEKEYPEAFAACQKTTHNPTARIRKATQ